MTKSRAIATLLIASTLFFSKPGAATCFPEQDNSVKAEYARSTLVLTGIVTEAHLLVDPTDPGWSPGIVYTLKTEHPYRGKAPATFVVLSENDSGRFPMEVGVSYLLFLSAPDDKHQYGASNCGNSGDASTHEQTLMLVEKLSGQNAVRATGSTDRQSHFAGWGGSVGFSPLSPRPAASLSLIRTSSPASICRPLRAMLPQLGHCSASHAW